MKKLLVPFLIGVVVTALAAYYYIKPLLQEEKQKMEAMQTVAASASFLCGYWQVKEKKFLNDRLSSVVLTNPLSRLDHEAVIPDDLDPELRRAWNHKKRGDTVEVVIAPWRLREYVQKGGKLSGPVAILAPDSINDPDFGPLEAHRLWCSRVF